MNWRPIDTAPKDGTAILACAVYPDFPRHYVPIYAVWGTYHPNAKGKVCWRTASICGNKLEGLTHWMPLPERPKP
jgi:hypothetical protein